MYVTEEEAKQKECKPKEIALAIAAVTGNAVGSPKCTASDCMMWRGRETRSFTMEADLHYKRLGQNLEPGPSDIEGYCGLAGRPE